MKAQAEQMGNLMKPKYLILGGIIYMIIFLGTVNPWNILYYKWLAIVFRVLACTFLLPFLIANWVILMSKEDN
jgi:hypothetical protein